MLKLKEGCRVLTIDKGVAIVAVGPDGSPELFRGNETMRLLAEMLEKGTSVERMVNLLTCSYEIEEERAQADVEKVLAHLCTWGLLVL